MAKSAWPDWDIYIRDRCRCVYCGLDGTSLPTWRQLTIDHVVPRSRGGADEGSNKVVSCLSCNFTKGLYDPREGSAVARSTPDLIEAAKRYLQERRLRSDERADFDRMMSELAAKPR
jgi:5-methylcytosine-specific restriction endonuclease McrA